MKSNIPIKILIAILTIAMFGCSLKWTKAIQSGAISQSTFNDTIILEVKRGLIFLPVTISEKQYRFLFDTGAPFCISKDIQSDYNFKIVSKSNIVDSDLNKKKVDWVKVDSMNLGKVLFTNQTAFIGDFDTNPILKCLEIDGIIGSNLIRHCNWAINPDKNSINLQNSVNVPLSNKSITMPFQTDYQNNIFIDMSIGQLKIKNVLVDYGSNGSITLNKEIFTQLKEDDIIQHSYLEEGVIQSGIIGKPVNLKREVAWSDSITFNKTRLKDIMLRTGETTSIGNRLLSRFQITIDWGEKNLYLKASDKYSSLDSSLGIKMGYTIGQGIHIQSIIENSIAFKNGIRPGMKVIKIDSLNFEENHDFCDYVNYETGDNIFIELIDLNGEKQEFQIEKAIIRNN